MSYLWLELFYGTMVNVKYQGNIFPKKKKPFTWAISFEWQVIELSYFSCIFFEVRRFFCTKVKVICPGQGLISRSQKMAVAGAFVFVVFSLEI